MFDEAVEVGCQTATDNALEKEAEWSKEIEDFGCTFVDLTDEQRQVFKEACQPEREAIEEAVAPEVWAAYTA